MKSIQTLALAGLTALGLSGCTTTYVAKTMYGQSTTQTQEIIQPKRIVYSLEQERIREKEFQAVIFEEITNTTTTQTVQKTPTESIAFKRTISPTAGGWILGNGVYLLANVLSPLTLLSSSFVPPPILVDPFILCKEGADDTFYSQWCRGNFGYDWNDIGHNNPIVETNKNTYVSGEREISREKGEPEIKIISEKNSSDRIKRILPERKLKVQSTKNVISPNPYFTTTDQRGIVRIPFTQEAGKLEFILLDSESEIPLKTISLDLQ